jgi:hypothetical protein
MEGVFGTLLYEDFSGDFLPEGWSQEQPYEWELYNGSNAGGVAPEAFLYWNFVQGGYACLDSKPINTLGSPTLKVSFNYSIDQYTGSFNCRVLAHSNPEAGWIDITPWTNPISSDVGAQEITIDISGYIGTGTQVRFEFEGTNSNLRMWYLDDVHIYSPITREPGDIVYTTENTIDLDAFATEYIDFTPQWNANINGVYAIKVTTELTTDQNTINDIGIGLVEIFEDTSPPALSNINDYPDPQVVDGFVNISLTATDETNIGSVYVDITGPSGFNPVNVTMTPCGSNQHYYYANYSIIGNYTYFIWANDTIGHSVKSSTYTFSILNESYLSLDINLDSGWNLISVPVVNGWYASDLVGNVSGCLYVVQWDSVDQEFWIYVPGFPAFDFLLVPGCGYFVEMSTSGVLSMVGLPVMEVNVPLTTGVNLIGWYHNWNTTASSILENVSGCSSVIKWDPLVQDYWLYLLGYPAFDFVVSPGMGLFVDVSVDSVWHGEG